MGGCRCSYKNCTNNTKTSENVHFFHFPIKNKERCEQWIEKAGKPNFYNLEEDILRNKVICEMHFESKWFPNNNRKRLLQGAFPSLDGDCNTATDPVSPVNNDYPVYLPSNQYNDVKVVPANDDGTVFVLDTENMFTISSKIESYIIKNGILVPTNSNNTIRNALGRTSKQAATIRFTKPSTSTAGYVMAAETEIANINTPPGPSRTLVKQPINCPTFIKSEIQETQETTRSKINEMDSEPPHEQEDKRPVIKQSSNQHSKTAVAKNYLRQIKQHSRDIASIKRMLKQKRIAETPKPNLKTILSELQKQIPPSLFTIIELILGEKNDLNDEDIDFFTTLHRGSPEVYQMLSDKYKWNLPSVDIVETPNE